MKSDFDRIHFLDKGKRERQIREQIRKDAKIPEEVYESAREAYQMIWNGEVRQEQEEKRKTISFPVSAAVRLAGSMAAVLAVCVFVNVVFPAQARALPVVGSIFERIQNELGYENISEYAQTLEEDADPDADGDVNIDMKENDNTNKGMKEDGDTNKNIEKNADANKDMKEAGDAYTKTNGGLTVSCSEVYADEETIYLSMKLKSEEPFPKSFYYTNGEEMKKIEGKVAMTLSAEKKYSFMEEAYYEYVYDSSVVPGRNRSYLVEGIMVNENTFECLWRIGLNEDLEPYRNWSNADEEVSLPEKFTLELNINSIASTLSMARGYMGPWEFRIPVTIDDSHRETVELHETNETGAGLLSVEKTPFEITTRAIAPGITGYKAVVLDARGNKLPCVLSNEVWTDETLDNKWLIQGADVSSIEVFVLGKDFYENVYVTGKWWEVDWDGNEKKPEEEKLRTLLRKHADFYKVIHFENEEPREK